MASFDLKRLQAAKKSAAVNSSEDAKKFADGIAQLACEEVVAAFESIAKSATPSKPEIAVAIDRFCGHIVDSMIAERSAPVATKSAPAPVQHGAAPAQKSAPLATPRQRPPSDGPLTRAFARNLGVRGVLTESQKASALEREQAESAAEVRKRDKNLTRQMRGILGF